ncbi:MAG: MltA domain-containing protein [Hylemonella sp.]|nr:MltA domain-containing protein [Hylemonella sp.]
MVHQTINISISSAPSASSKSNHMKQLHRRVAVFGLAIVGTLAGCGGFPVSEPAPESGGPLIAVEQAATLPPKMSVPTQPASRAVLQQARSRWTPVAWAELPGLGEDPLGEAWSAWVRSCDRPGPAFAPLCADVRRLGQGSDEARRNWMLERLQPYRVEDFQGEPVGLLTGYYEPVVEASRLPTARHTVPLYGVPAQLHMRKPWYSRQEIDTLPEARAALKGREIAWLADPVAALNLQIQGSGRLLVSEPDGRQRMVRLAYAGTNDQPYRSVGGWLLQRREVRDASWPSIRNWVAQNPGRVQEMLWSNPRVTFFVEQPLPESETAVGPRGAQGVPLTAGRSIAVDPGSIPYGTPVWLASPGPQLQLQRLVLAQDTGSAITGAVRADYFVGTGPDASQIAGRMKQPLRMWVLWPR